ncbi:MAG: TetR/AcrR family transcriptional regulator [Caulobacteraceae bacterium]
MAGVSKEPDKRRLEIIEASERLFNEKGFENTAVSDIVKSIGVAQGTFYYYFKSKDDAFNAIAERFMEGVMSEITDIADNEKTATIEKIEAILDSSFRFIEDNVGVFTHLHTEVNIGLHERIEKVFIENMTPVAIRVVKQGIAEKIFNTEYP